MNLRMIRFVLILGAAGVAYLFGNPDSTAQSGDPVVHFDPADQTMNTAQDEARRTLPKFLATTVDANGISQRDTLVKVAFPVDASDAGVEVIWVSAFTMKGDRFSGRLSNEPVHMQGYKMGSTVSFSEDMIRDWIMPAPDGRAFGHYTTRVIAAQSGDENFQAAISQMLTPNPAPEGW